MREIKFRAWHIANKIMASVGDFNWSGKVHVSYEKGPEKAGYFFGGNNVGDDWEKHEHILMQYTGLKDKNGKEIYHKDIFTMNEMQVGNLIKLIGYIEWEGDRFITKWITPTIFNDSLRVRNNDIEVIGNIHETPELLK